MCYVTGPSRALSVLWVARMRPTTTTWMIARNVAKLASLPKNGQRPQTVLVHWLAFESHKNQQLFCQQPPLNLTLLPTVLGRVSSSRTTFSEYIRLDFDTVAPQHLRSSGTFCECLWRNTAFVTSLVMSGSPDFYPYMAMVDHGLNTAEVKFRVSGGKILYGTSSCSSVPLRLTLGLGASLPLELTENPSVARALASNYTAM